MRNLPFLFVCALAGRLSDATPAVRIAPVFRKVRRVTGETDGECVFIRSHGFSIEWAATSSKRRTASMPKIIGASAVKGRNTQQLFPGPAATPRPQLQLSSLYAVLLLPLYDRQY